LILMSLVLSVALMYFTDLIVKLLSRVWFGIRRRTAGA